MTLKAFAMAVRRYWLTYIIVSAVVLALGLSAILLAPARYVSSTRLMVSIEGSTTASAYQNDQVATRRVPSYIPLITSGVVGQRVIDKLGLPLTPSQLDAKIDVANVPPKTPLIDIEVTDDSPKQAQQIANTLADEFISYATSIETPTGEDSQKVHTTVVTTASEGRQSNLLPVFLGALAAVAALLLGAVAVWIRATRKSPPSPAKHASLPTKPVVAGEDTAPEETAPIPTNGNAPSNTAEVARGPVGAKEVVKAAGRG